MIDVFQDTLVARSFIAVLEPYDTAAAAVVPLYYSSHSFVTRPDDTPPNTYYAPRISSALNLGRSLYQNARLSGRTEPATGAIGLNNIDGELDFLANYAWSGRRARIYIGHPSFRLNQYTLIFDGTVGGLEWGDTGITVRLNDNQLLLDNEIQTARYAGTGGKEGGEDLKGRLKPRAIGTCINVEPLYLGVINGLHTYSVSDGAITGITAVRDAGVELTLVNNGVTPGAGQAASNNADGTVSVGSTPTGRITVDVIGRPFDLTTSATSVTVGVGSKTFTVDKTLADFPAPPGSAVAIRANPQSGSWPLMLGKVTSYSGTTLVVDVYYADPYNSGVTTGSAWSIVSQGTTAGLLRYLAKELIPGVPVDAPAVTALATAQPSRIGFYLAEGGNGLEVMDAIANAAGAFYGFDRQGRFTVGRIEQPASASRVFDTLTNLSVSRNATQDPSSEVVVKYHRVWAPLGADQFAGSVSAGTRTLLSNEWRQVTATDAAVKASYPLSQPIEVQSLFIDAADARAEASRLLALYGVRRDYYEIKVKAQGLQIDLGETVQLIHNRYGLENGKAFCVVDLVEDLDAVETTIGLWG